MKDEVIAKVKHVTYMKTRKRFIVVIQLISGKIDIGSILTLERTKAEFEVTGDAFIPPEANNCGIREILLKEIGGIEELEDGLVIDDILVSKN